MSVDFFKKSFCEMLVNLRHTVQCLSTHRFTLRSLSPVKIATLTTTKNNLATTYNFFVNFFEKFIQGPEQDSNNDDSDEKDNSDGGSDDPKGDASHRPTGAVLITHRPDCVQENKLFPYLLKMKLTSQQWPDSMLPFSDRSCCFL